MFSSTHLCIMCYTAYEKQWMLIDIFIYLSTAIFLEWKTNPNNHPNCPTFLEVYEMLTMYSILKPHKTGNCFVLD